MTTTTLSTSTPTVPTSKAALWAGRVLTALPILALVASAVMKLTHAPELVTNWVNQFGWPEHLLTPVGAVELVVAVLFAIPRTAVLGAILIAAYLGAAFATHLRVDDAAGGITPIVIAVFAWAALYIRDERVRALLPLRT